MLARRFDDCAVSLYLSSIMRREGASPPLPGPDHLFEGDLREGLSSPLPAAVVIFGATGDLAQRKILPALFKLARSGRFHERSIILAVGRRALDSESYVRGVASAIRAEWPIGEEDEAWISFASRIRYVRGDIADSLLFDSLRRILCEQECPSIRIFYVAVGPDLFARIADGLADAGLGSISADSGVSSRLVVEKPFGGDLGSARELSFRFQKAFHEWDIYRVDHYLGKETVQNLLYLRFANSVFEPLWNRDHIERVEIDALETAGIGSRGGYYDRAGAARDMLQNHLLQLLCLTAMEVPAAFDPQTIRDEKVKVLRSIPRYMPRQWRERVVRGRYAAGKTAGGFPARAYLEEERVDPSSTTETYVAVKVEIDNWRFAGVPFVLRTGKALDRHLSEVRIFFRSPPHSLLSAFGGSLERNILRIRIQPDEGVWLTFNMKIPGMSRVESHDLSFSWKGSGQAQNAYERLLDDVMRGDSTLFIRSDELEASWELIDSLRASWSTGDGAPLREYPVGSEPLPLPGEST